MESLPPSFILPAGKAIKPVQQGSIDNLCGVYSIINALRLITPGSSDRDRNLLEAAVTYLDEREWLSSVMLEGTHTALFAAMARHLAALNGYQIARIASSHHREGHGQAIMRSLVAELPILVSIEPPLDHYSVIYGYTPNRWLLFDSYGYRWLRKNGCTWGGAKTARHRVIAWQISARHSHGMLKLPTPRDS